MKSEADGPRLQSWKSLEALCFTLAHKYVTNILNILLKYCSRSLL